MHRLIARFGLFLLALLLSAATVSAQNVHLAVIVGLAGDPEHGELFQKWAGALVDAGIKRYGIPRERIVYLVDKLDGESTAANGRSTRDEITKAFEALAQKAAADDVVFVVLIGHGTFDGRVAKFNLPGPDMTAADFEPLLKRLDPRRVVLVNTASASGPFIEALSGPGRTIVTATRNGAERFATLFGGFFVDALTADAADADKNKRVTVLEAFTYARREVATAYEREGIMLTEHALLDDTGDREGSAQPTADGKEGRVASILSLGTVASGEAPPADPKLRALYDERRTLERRVESLRLLKDSMDPQRYSSELEKVLTDLALKSRQIREAGGREPLREDRP
jgi:peptidase C13-like protein